MQLFSSASQTGFEGGTTQQLLCGCSGFGKLRLLLGGMCCRHPGHGTWVHKPRARRRFAGQPHWNQLVCSLLLVGLEFCFLTFWLGFERKPQKESAKNQHPSHNTETQLTSSWFSWRSLAQTPQSLTSDSHRVDRPGRFRTLSSSFSPWRKSCKTERDCSKAQEIHPALRQRLRAHNCLQHVFHLNHRAKAFGIAKWQHVKGGGKHWCLCC